MVWPSKLYTRKHHINRLSSQKLEVNSGRGKLWDKPNFQGFFETSERLRELDLSVRPTHYFLKASPNPSGLQEEKLHKFFFALPDLD